MLPTGSRPEILPLARRALAQSRRVLDRLQEDEASAERYRDYLPWVLDRLDNVWRTIDSESSGRRTPEFGRWWALQTTGNRHAIKVLRNAEVKRNEQSTRQSRIYQSRSSLEIREDGSWATHGPDGSELATRADGSPVPLIVDELVEVTWTFALPGVDDRPVQQVLETVYERLSLETVPTAEQMLTVGPPALGAASRDAKDA